MTISSGEWQFMRHSVNRQKEKNHRVNTCHLCTYQACVFCIARKDARLILHATVAVRELQADFCATVDAILKYMLFQDITHIEITPY